MKRLTEGAHQTSDDLTNANTAHTLGMIHPGELLFTAVYRAKHVHNLLGVGDNIR